MHGWNGADAMWLLSRWRRSWRRAGLAASESCLATMMVVSLARMISMAAVVIAATITGIVALVSVLVVATMTSMVSVPSTFVVMATIWMRGI